MVHQTSSSYNISSFILPLLIPLPLALHDCKLNSQTVKIILVKISIVVQVIHVPDQELYAVVPGLRHHKLYGVASVTARVN